MSKKVIIVGSGIAGIATSIRLAKKGYEVTVFEANAYPGGKLSAFNLGAYRFDAGPSLFTMPQFVEELFELFDEANKAPSKYIVAFPFSVPNDFSIDECNVFTSLQESPVNA